MNRIAAAIMWLGGAVMVNVAANHDNSTFWLSVGWIGALTFFVLGFIWLFVEKVFRQRLG